MSRMRLATHDPIGMVTSSGCSAWPYGPAALVTGSFDGKRRDSMRVPPLLSARETAMSRGWLPSAGCPKRHSRPHPADGYLSGATAGPVRCDRRFVGPAGGGRHECGIGAL